METLLDRITEKKEKLDTFRPLPQEVIKNLNEWYKVELTYTSNAIEGNTLSRAETALVIEKGITVAGKTLQEHLEAINHAEALDYIRTLASGTRKDITEKEVNQIHWLILKGIEDSSVGKYRVVQVKIAGTNVELPIAVKVPELMEGFYKWLHGDLQEHPIKIAADAHFKFVSIHPFIDGNGRTARLLMNLLLIQQGFPPAIIRKEDRKVYIDSLEKGQMTDAMEDYYQVIYQAVERSLDVYLEVLEPQKKAG
ncbi:MAG: Fic family protein [bacterium]